MFSIPPELQEDLKNQQVVILAGAGVSLYAHYPNWKELLIEIFKKISRDKDPKYKPYIELIQSGAINLLSALDEIKQFEPVAREVLKEKFNTVPSNLELSIHKKIANISRRIITTNYDRLFEMATGISPICPGYTFELAKLAHLKEYIFKVHGSIENVAGCILFKEDYNSLYKCSNAAYSELRNLVMNHTVLCIGSSMSDPYMGSIFSAISDLYRQYKRNHYIITTDNSDYSEYNIQPIRIGSYDELGKLLDSLSKFSIENDKEAISQKKSKEYITKRFLRRRCRYSPVGSKDFINILTELTTTHLGIDTKPNYIKQLASLQSDFEKAIALSAFHEKMGDITRMLNELESNSFSGKEESVRLLFLGIAYEKLDRIDEAIDSYQKILSKEDDEKLIRSAQFNLHVCFEKKQTIDNNGFTYFLNSDVTLLGGQRIKDKALTMHIIMCIKEKCPFKYNDLLEESLNYERKVNPIGYIKTMLSFIELKDEALSESELEMIMNILSGDTGVNAQVAILKKIYDQLPGSETEIKKRIENTLLTLNNICSDPTVKKYSRN